MTRERSASDRSSWSNLTSSSRAFDNFLMFPTLWDEVTLGGPFEPAAWRIEPDSSISAFKCYLHAVGLSAIWG